MKFDVEKVKAMAREMNEKERAEMEYREENAEWLQFSAIIALRIRKLLRQKGLSQADLAERLGVTPAQVSKLLSGKVNFELKTIVKIQNVLEGKILEIPSDEVAPSTGRKVKRRGSVGSRCSAR